MSADTFPPATVWLPVEELGEVAEHVRHAPILRVTERAQTHVQRSRWARKSRHTRSQARLLSDAEKREAVALAILARLWPSAWSTHEIAEHCGLHDGDVEAVVAEWERDGLVLRTCAGIDLATPELLERLGVGQ